MKRMRGEIVVAGALALGLVMGAPTASADGPSVAWEEHFDRGVALQRLGWVDPFDHSYAELARIYSVEHAPEGAAESEPRWFLHAHHDASVKHAPKSYDLGHAWQTNPPRLDRVKSLSWKWRVNKQPPSPSDDPWLDMAASVYVVIQVPSLFKGGKGFKFGWLPRPAPTGTYQHGLLQIPLRADPAGPVWRSESVDLCALYRKEYGPCEGQHLLYVGVVTDADGTKSVADGDYADFQVEMVGP